MFEITPADISLLKDDDLRTLVALLCESEVRSRGCSASSVTWGGNQNASDGGLDVRVDLPIDTKIDGFIPRANTGFQVKRDDMPPAKIMSEMCPNDELRPVIAELAEQSGAYVIVSSIGSTSDSALRRRRDAMKDALRVLPNASRLKVDFYDRTRLATWVRDHPGIIPWVRERIGKQMHGWRSYENWAQDPKGVNGEYLLDDHVRVFSSADAKDGGSQALAGLEEIREVLRNPRGIVRLVGLSGVGKTRFVQALFDVNLGKNYLEPSLAVYTNVSDGPTPQPIALANQLIAARMRVCLVVDNCPPDLHARLAGICRSQGSHLSLVTVEYDVREDVAEGTEVFRLAPSSDSTIEKLIRSRFPHVSPVNARTVAESSGGNFRLALALAGNIGENESVSNLSDHELFNRLFRQRNEPNDLLLQSAQALSLVYSFQGEDISNGDDAELFRLGNLVAKTSKQMYADAAELKRRELVQERGVWRAVLPHALANRLAVLALENIHVSEIEAELVDGGSARLFRSFSRRLSYLVGCKQAEAIATKWMSPGGRLGEIAQLDDFGVEVFNNVAPVVPEAALSALERALLGVEDRETVASYTRYIYLLRSLAHEPTAFERCIELLVRIALTGDIESDANEARRAFLSLFPLYLSGTHASVKQRLDIVMSLYNSSDSRRIVLGSMALRTMLEALHFGPVIDFEFGSRSRDYGYWPSKPDEWNNWFNQTLGLTEVLACSEGLVGSRTRVVLSDQFRGLWTQFGLYDTLERVSRTIR